MYIYINGKEKEYINSSYEYELSRKRNSILKFKYYLELKRS